MVQYYFDDSYEKLFVLRLHDEYLLRQKCVNKTDPTPLLLRPLHIILCNQVFSASTRSRSSSCNDSRVEASIRNHSGSRSIFL